MFSHQQKAILLLSPGLSQACSFAFWLKRYSPCTRIIGGIAQNDQNVILKHPFDEIIRIQNSSDFNKFEFVLPMGSASTQWLTNECGAFQAGNVLFSADNLRVYDKPWLFDLARKAHVPVPETFLNFENIPDDDRPLFYKPRIEGFNGPRRRANFKKSIPIYARTNNYLFQEYISGRDVYGFGFIARSGKVVAACQHVEIASMPFDGGSAVAVKNINDPRIFKFSAKLIEILNYDGWGLVEFKYCARRKDYVLMELNAKWWASVEFALRSEPAFGKILFGIDGIKEPLNGLFWPNRFLTSLRGNMKAGIHSAVNYPWAWDRNLPRLRSIIAGVLPASVIDSYSKNKFKNVQ
jgi:hypothetical protein